MIEAHVREWCEQILVEVVLAARNSTWRAEQLGALLSPTSLTAALLPRHLLHVTLQKRLGQKLRALRGDAGGSSPDSTTRDLPAGRAPAGLRRRTGRSQEGRRAGSGDPIIGARQGGPDVAARPRRRRDAAAPLHAGRSGSSESSRPVDGHRDRGDDLRQASRRSSSSVAHTSQDPRQARTAAVRPDARAGTSIRSGCECPGGSRTCERAGVILARCLRSDFVPAGDSRAHIHRYWLVSAPAGAWVPVAQLSQEVLDLQEKHA